LARVNLPEGDALGGAGCWYAGGWIGYKWAVWTRR